MDEYTMSAFALYPDGRSGDAFAEVCGPSLVDCFAEMAGEVADWLPGALARGEGTRPPRAIELTLEWSAAPAPERVPERPTAPSDPASARPEPPRRSLRCAARRRLGNMGESGLAVGRGHWWSEGLMGAAAPHPITPDRAFRLPACAGGVCQSDPTRPPASPSRAPIARRAAPDAS